MTVENLSPLLELGIDYYLEMGMLQGHDVIGVLSWGSSICHKGVCIPDSKTLG